MKRLIPVLLVKDRGLYKGVKFKKHTYFGDPLNVIKIFNDKEVDELIILDISNSAIDFDFIESIVSESFIPVTYGGMIRSLDDARRLFSIGIEKLSIQSGLFENPDLISQITDIYGAQSLVVSIDVKKNFWGAYMLYDHRSSKVRDKKLDNYLRELENHDFCELLVQSVDREGTFSGVDVDLITNIQSCYSGRVLYSGGVGSDEDIFSFLSSFNSLAVGSYFIMKKKHRAAMISYISNI